MRQSRLRSPDACANKLAHRPHQFKTPQLNGYDFLKALDIGYFFYTDRYVDAIGKVLDPSLKTIAHIPNVNSRESLRDKIKEVNEIMNTLGGWKGVDPVTGFHTGWPPICHNSYNARLAPRIR